MLNLEDISSYQIFFNLALLGVFIVILGSALWIVKSTSLFAIVLVSGVYSAASSLFYALMGAVDVALTESAIGVGIATVLSLATIFITMQNNKPRSLNYYFSIQKIMWTMVICMLALAVFIFTFIYFPEFGNGTNPTINNTYYSYVSGGFTTQVPNLVTLILGSFRGFDTLGETLVVFVTAVAITALIGNNFNSKTTNKPK